MPISVGPDGEFAIDPDPEEVLGRYKQQLSDSQHRVLVLETAVTESLREIKSLTGENESLNAQVEALTGGGQVTVSEGDSPPAG
jgi:hypothetical protein